MRRLSPLVVLALGLIGCRGDAPSQRATPLRVVHESAPLSLDPIVVSDAATNSALGNLYEPLVDFDREMRLVPRLAVAWSTPDDRTWLFELRPGVTFHDGRGFGAADVVATLDRARAEPGSAYKGQLTALESVTAEGPLRVRVVTRLASPLLLNRLAALFIVPARSGDLAQQPLGTGPYRFVSREGDDLELAGFAGHWRGKPAIGRVRLLVRQGPAVLAGLRDGSIDVARNLSARIASEPGRFSTVERPGLTSLYLWMDSRPAASGEPRNPFADARVRQALALGLDRQALLAELGQPGVAMNQLAPAGVVGHIGGWPALPHDAAAASALLRQAGYPDGLDATVAESGAPPPDNVAQALRQALLPLGVRLSVQHTTWPLLVAGWESAELPLFVAGWRFETGEVTGFLRDCIATRNPAHGYSSFNPGFSDPALDSLIAESPGFIGRREGLARQEALMRRALDALPLLPLFTRHDRYGVADGVRFAPRLDGRLSVEEMAWQSR